ncbi:hypothetical protein [Mycobacterium sp. IDR2000157661]|uniref:hypothetical protein n=1 Tax=Mycobacterium sp. IDR2000157661 TaxID=2867005 RepID=UPI001EED79C5|nr:hypothetical protein [Mycobacterium sp. IDR2000157661]ULE35101.1 hypothetical protein K3G64_11340 [Mycobacterium sp. IDR2000157661]
MSTALTILILIAPPAAAVAFGWAARRSGVLRFRLDQFRMAAPMAGRLFTDDRDVLRMEHDLEAIRTRFEHHPIWPSSGALGERR